MVAAISPSAQGETLTVYLRTRDAEHPDRDTPWENAWQTRLPGGAFSWERGAPALMNAGDVFIVAAISMSGHVVVARLRFRSPRRGRPGNPQIEASELVAVAAPADRRFPPALALTEDGFRLAYVRQGRVMRVHVLGVTLALDVTDRHDVTPPAMGATAPVFTGGIGEGDLALLVTDAREGFSPIVKVPFDSQGTPQESDVLRTVGTLPLPPQLAVLSLPGRLAVGYTAIGGGAATAVGLVFAPDDGAPTPLVPSFGYGRLTVVASGQLFASTAATAREKSAPRKIVIHSVGQAGPRQEGTIPAPAARPSLASDSAGGYLLGFSAPTHLRAAFVACKEGGSPEASARATDVAP